MPEKCDKPGGNGVAFIGWLASNLPLIVTMLMALSASHIKTESRLVQIETSLKSIEFQLDEIRLSRDKEHARIERRMDRIEDARK